MGFTKYFSHYLRMNNTLCHLEMCLNIGHHLNSCYRVMVVILWTNFKTWVDPFSVCTLEYISFLHDHPQSSWDISSHITNKNVL